MVVNWQVDSFDRRERYDAWVHILNRTYGSWDMQLSRNRDYFARLSTKTFGDFSVTDCVCDPCTGNRARTHIARDDREMLAIQLTLDGLEHMRYGNENYVLEGGDIVVWDTTQQMTFQVERQLHKISIILPLQRLKDWMPANWHSIPRKIPAGSPSGHLLASHIMALSGNELGDVEVDGCALSEATIALLFSALNGQPAAAPVSLKENQLRRIKEYIGRNLDNPNLTLEMIARANRISLRYLHWLFSSTDKTVSQYILERRLANCRRDLMNPLMTDRTIATIALSWGFNDPTHFSRRFKEIYRERPTEVREKALVASPAARPGC